MSSLLRPKRRCPTSSSLTSLKTSNCIELRNCVAAEAMSDSQAIWHAQTRKLPFFMSFVSPSEGDWRLPVWRESFANEVLGLRHQDTPAL